MPYCNDCGSKLESSERFCGNCGKSQQLEIMPVAGRLPIHGAKPKWLLGLVGLVVLAFVVGGVIFFALPETSIDGTYVLQEGDLFTVINEITFNDGTARMKTFGMTLPGVPFEVRGQTIYMEHHGTMQAMFEIIDADTIKSNVTGFSGVYSR